MKKIFNLAAFFVGFLLSLGIGISHAYNSHFVDAIDTDNGSSVCIGTDLTIVDTHPTGHVNGKYGSAWLYDSSGRLYYQEADGGFTRYDRDQFKGGSCESRDIIPYDGYPPGHEPPPSENGVKDPDEDGIDCGGDTGVPCVPRCPTGYILLNGICVKSTSPPDDMIGDTYPDGTPITADDDWVNPWLNASPILASPDADIPDTAWDSGNNISPSTDDGDIRIDGSVGDYIVRDDDGNIVAAKITGDPETTDNGDGTSTVVNNTITYNSDTGQNQTTTTTTTVDNATGDTVDTRTNTTGTSGTSTGTTTLVGVGLGNSGSLSGDEYARGTDLIVGAINGVDEDGAPASFSAPSDGAVEYGENDESEYDSDSYLDDYISEYSDFGWLPLFTDSHVVTSDQYCSIDGSVTLLSQDVPISLSMCEFEGHFESLGIIFAVICQFYALIIAFGGID